MKKYPSKNFHYLISLANEMLLYRSKEEQGLICHMALTKSEKPKICKKCHNIIYREDKFCVRCLIQSSKNLIENLKHKLDLTYKENDIDMFFDISKLKDKK